MSIWDARSGEVLRTLQHNEASSVAFSPDGQRLVADSRGGTLRIWNLSTGKVLRTIKDGGGGSHWQVAFSPDGRRVASPSSDNTIKVWDVEKDQEYVALRGAGGNRVAITPDFRRLASVSYTVASIWDVQTGQKTLSLKGHTFPLVSVAISPDGKRLACGGGGSFLPDGDVAWGARDRGEVKVWDAETGQELLCSFVPENTLGPASCVAFSPDGKRLASGHSRTIKVWDAQTGKELLSIARQAPAYTVAFSPDGKHLASESGGREAAVWDAQTGEKLLTLSGHTCSVHSVAYSTDGKLLVTASGDGTGRVWNAQTGQEIVVLPGCDGNLVFNSASGQKSTSRRQLCSAMRHSGSAMRLKHCVCMHSAGIVAASFYQRTSNSDDVAPRRLVCRTRLTQLAVHPLVSGTPTDPIQHELGPIPACRLC